MIFINRHSFIPLLIICCFQMSVYSQSTFYTTDELQEIRLYFIEDNWDEILDDNFFGGSSTRLTANVEINGIAYDSVGVRYKGFSSASPDRIKNPFNIKLDYHIDGQNHEGFDKLKLSNVIQDPSFVREVLSYEIARKYMPASRANFAELYINDKYWGVYTNVEAVNKDFISNHFSTNKNAFFKGNPESLDFDGGNSNLEQNHGTDPENYTPYYKLESDEGWAELYLLIDQLNNQSDQIEDYLHIDRTLWMHAFNYALINFDSYVGYAQNYYLYRDKNGQFSPILWDLNMSFASFRFTDASLFFDGFSIEEAKNMDPLQHYIHPSIYGRPLMRMMFEKDRTRRMYLAHIRTIIEETMEGNWLQNRGNTLQSIIDGSVQLDSNKFYTYEDFLINLDTTVTYLIEYPGIQDLMKSRSAYLMEYEGIKDAPIITNVKHFPENPMVGNPAHVSAEITGSPLVDVYFRSGPFDRFQSIQMFDDGNHDDGAANDGVYGATIPHVSNQTQYYIWADNGMAGRFSPVRASHEFYTIQGNFESGDIVINELLAVNDQFNADDNGDFDDWVELYNPKEIAINICGLSLTDDKAIPNKWLLPCLDIEPKGYVLVWADDQSNQGQNHANFKLSSEGEFIGLYQDSVVIDSITFGQQIENVSFGRFPNGEGPFEVLYPTPEKMNAVSSTNEGQATNNDWSMAPNPANHLLDVTFKDRLPTKLTIASLDGHIQFLKLNAISAKEEVDISDLPQGLYLLNVYFNEVKETKKLVIIK